MSLSKKEISKLKGGDYEICCWCGCLYANGGGSSTMENSIANINVPGHQDKIPGGSSFGAKVGELDGPKTKEP
jgi:natural product precursor